MHDLSKFKILVIDDDPDMLAFITAVLEDNGASVFTACNGIDGLKAAKIVIPDLITLDLSMPEMDGEELVKHIRQDSGLSEIPILIMSGVIRAKDISNLLKVGATAFLPKPVAIKDLKDFINNNLS